ncbi:TlpA family protein disulfide reductase [Sphingomonas alpina]|uniref:TlpA family protein disulfide reductase n=1 Tax=Sphingomonas alpina TaxID=653931 RepID=A0A7H0LI00_9SPHN|nr:TlpA family protein disulfide reductase [Sphingomonas alpina]
MSLRSTIICLLGAGLLVGGCDRQDSAAEQANAATPAKVGANGTENAATASVEPASAPGAPKEGEKVIVDTIGTLDRSHKGEKAPGVPFQTPAGTKTSIADFAGKPVLLNLWATWCGPCVAEMPTLDAVAGRMTVVAVSQDLEGAAKVTPFFARTGVKNLKPYLDPDVALSTAYQVSLPTSILYDSSGKEVWRMTGGMDWTSETAKQLLAEAA